MNEVKEILVTPDMARTLLRSNHPKQRHLSQWTVNQYAADMANGMWSEDVPNTILISENGELLDGQHRLSAVIQADKPVKMRIIYDVKEGAFEYIDNGRTRHVTDFLSGRYKSQVVALARTLYALEHGATFKSAYEGKYGGVPVTRQQVLATLNEDHTGFERLAQQASRIREAVGYGPNKAFGFGIWCIQNLSDKPTIEFLAEMGNPETDNQIIIRFRMSTLRLYAKQQKADGYYVFGLFLSAFEAFSKKQTGNRLNDYMKVIEKYEKRYRTFHALDKEES